MSIFSKLFGKGSKISESKSQSKTEPVSNEPSEKEIFQSPDLLAQWVMKYVVKIYSVEDDFSHAPDDEARQNLNITYEQIERLAREEAILRAVGASFFIKQNYDDQFYIRYFSNLYKPIAGHMYGEPTKEQISDTRDALEGYINSIANEEDDELRGFSTQYMRRVYDDNENYLKMMLSGIPNLAIDSSLNVFEAMRDAYYKVTQGMSYESAVKIAEALEQVKNENA